MKVYELMRNEEKQKIEKEKSETKNEIVLLKIKLKNLKNQMDWEKIMIICKKS